MQEFMTIPEIIAAARGALSKELWDFTAGGAGGETTLRRNRTAVEGYAFRPRVLRDVSQRSLKTELLGHSLEIPVLFAPVGSVDRYCPDALPEVARVAGRMGTIGFMSGVALPSLEEVAAAATGPMVYQIYVRGDRPWLEALVRRVEAAGFSAICMTVDSPVVAFRDRTRENRSTVAAGGDHPNLQGVTASGRDHQARLGWEDIEWLRGKTRLPLVLKGVLSPEDAVLAVERYGTKPLGEVLAPAIEIAAEGSRSPTVSLVHSSAAARSSESSPRPGKSGSEMARRSRPATCS